MSRYSGPQRRGAKKLAKDQRREEGQERLRQYLAKSEVSMDDPDPVATQPMPPTESE